MTDIEFKVQFVSESFRGKGSCKGTVFKETGCGGVLGKPALSGGFQGAASGPLLQGGQALS